MGNAVTHPGLLANVINYPDDDAPRLVYADWLDENGDHTRGEFIRLQCWLALQKGEHCDGYYCETYDDGSTMHVDCRLRKTRERVGQLLKTHGSRWDKELPIMAPYPEAGYFRGFVESVRCHIDAFVEKAGELFNAAPIRKIYLEGVQPVNLANGGVYYWTCWYGSLGSRLPHEIPFSIYQHINDGKPGYHVFYLTLHAAYDVLAQAAYAYGKEQARLLKEKP